MIVRSLNVGGPATYQYEGKEVTTAFFKFPVAGPLFLSKTGFPGDEQVDMVHHGGPEKAALLYSEEHSAYWARELGHDPGPAAMGETLTVSGIDEAGAHIGDVYTIGEATVQVCQPRVPCYKANIRHGIPDMVRRVQACGFTGFYVRVLTEGNIHVGDAITLVSRIEGNPTVAELNHLVYHDQSNRAALERCAEAEGLAEVWRNWLRKLLG
ncbi:MAG TPA: MOSC domain-containing protein [Symbiobacteriaceae bacterium]|nr:MOSC domain-containing protein [Symbiobacteriaceae bacterium]